MSFPGYSCHSRRPSGQTDGSLTQHCGVAATSLAGGESPRATTGSLPGALFHVALIWCEALSQKQILDGFMTGLIVLLLRTTIAM